MFPRMSPARGFLACSSVGASRLGYTPPAHAARSITSCIRLRMFGTDGVFGHTCMHLCYDDDRWSHRDGYPPSYRPGG